MTIHQNELPFILNNGKPINLKTAPNIDLKRRMFQSVELEILFENKDLSDFKEFKFEIEVFLLGENKPFKTEKTDKQRVFVNGLFEQKIYIARVRGIDEELNLATIWSNDFKFNSLTGFFDLLYSIIFQN